MTRQYQVTKKFSRICMICFTMMIFFFWNRQDCYAFESACVTVSSPTATTYSPEDTDGMNCIYTVLDPYSDENTQAFVRLRIYKDGKQTDDLAMGFVPKGDSVTGYVTLNKLPAGTWKFQVVCVPYNMKNNSLDTSIKESDYPMKTVTFRVSNGNTGGSILKDSAGNRYRVISGKNKTAAYNRPSGKKITKVVIPATVKISGTTYKVTSVDNNAFSGCKKLTTVSIGKNVSTIGMKAFYKCTALKKVSISNNVKKIKGSAFYGCKKLKTVTIKTKNLKGIGKNAFKNISTKATIKIPKAKYRTYKKLLNSKTGYKKTMKLKKL